MGDVGRKDQGTSMIERYMMNNFRETAFFRNFNHNVGFGL